MWINLFLLIFLACFSEIIEAKELYSDFKKYKKSKTKLKVTSVSEGFNYPWGMTFINKNNLLITEKNGKIFKVNTSNGEKTLVKHNINSLKYFNSRMIFGQGGLLDILYHNGYVYISYSHLHSNTTPPKKVKSGSTAIGRGKLVDNEIKNFEILFISNSKFNNNKHWGSRIIIEDNFLYAGIGERDQGMIAQDPTKHPGSIIRIKIDGAIPEDNPKYAGYPNWLPEIFQIGLRNPQGISKSPHDGNIYFSQHGPMGGDNIATVKFGGNLGWKNIAWGGKEYSGKKIGNRPFKKKYDKLFITWVPSIGVGNFLFYKGDVFKEWSGDLMIVATKIENIIRLEIKNNKIQRKELILDKKFGRIRDLEINHKGEIFFIIDDSKSSLWRIEKAN